MAAATIIFKFTEVIVSPPVIILSEFPVAPAAARLVAMEEVVVPPPAMVMVAVSLQAYSLSCDYLFLLKMYSS
jgi:hypothetical protein